MAVKRLADSGTFVFRVNDETVVEYKSQIDARQPVFGFVDVYGQAVAVKMPSEFHSV